MAVYLASFNTPSETVSATALIAQSAAQEPTRVGPAQRLFTTACGACHHDGDGPVLLGQNIALALNSNLHSDRPDNLLRVILEGIREPATKDIGFMPAFRHHLDDAQVAQLAAWMRQRFAPGKPPWRDLEAASARARAETRMVGGH
jgi:nicotinate dehydrogenase subunit B